MVRFRESRDREENNVRESLVNNFFLKKFFSVIMSVKRKVILFTPLPDSKAAGFLISKSDDLFLKMDLMKFLSCIHEMILLDKMNTNCTKSLLEMLLEWLSQKYGKIKRYCLLRINEWKERRQKKLIWKSKFQCKKTSAPLHKRAVEFKNSF